MGDGEQKLGWFGAVLNALLNCKVTHYPRFTNRHGSVESISELSIIEQVSDALKNLKGTAEELKHHLDRGRETLDEVKSLTEYQDQKATRLLTIATVLAALSGVLFYRFMEAYPPRLSLQRFGASLDAALLIVTYALFALFLLSAASGALVIFHATRTRFKYPELDAEAPGRRRSRLGSYLFYSDIIELEPARWAAAFTAGGGSDVDPELSVRYLKNYIAESYLVASKVADKLRYLHPAQDILAFSMRALLVWLLLVGVTAVVVPSQDALTSKGASLPAAATVQQALPPAPAGTPQTTAPEGRH